MHLAYLLNSQATSSDNSGFTGDVAGSVDLAADVATVIFLAIGASLTFIFWYIANKPNVLVFPSHTNGVFSVHVRNEGRVAARDVRVECPTYTPSRSDSTESFGVNFLTLQPGEDLEYHIGVGNKVIDHEPYVFAVNHRKWLMLIGRERRVYAIDFSQYRDVIGRSEMTTNLEKLMEDVARNTEALLRLSIRKLDRWERFRSLWRFAKRRYLTKPDTK